MSSCWRHIAENHMRQQNQVIDSLGILCSELLELGFDSKIKLNGYGLPILVIRKRRKKK